MYKDTQLSKTQNLMNLPLEVTISFNLTMFSLFSALRIFTSRSAVMGKPFSSCSVLIRLSATISPVSLSAPTNTLLFGSDSEKNHDLEELVRIVHVCEQH